MYTWLHYKYTIQLLARSIFPFYAPNVCVSSVCVCVVYPSLSAHTLDVFYRILIVLPLVVRSFVRLASSIHPGPLFSFFQGVQLAAAEAVSSPQQYYYGYSYMALLVSVEGGAGRGGGHNAVCVHTTYIVTFPLASLRVQGNVECSIVATLF